jgi:hypothetical protein
MASKSNGIGSNDLVHPSGALDWYSIDVVPFAPLWHQDAIAMSPPPDSAQRASQRIW